jgi:AraC family transcriptional regulator
MRGRFEKKPLHYRRKLKMEWIDRLNCSIDYIENNLTGEIDMNEVAKIAACSSFHFQRMFSYMANVPLSEYIRRRKMSLAAADLTGENSKVINIALKYGYDSPTAFNRAFQRVHGFAPSEVKTTSHSIKSYPPIRFQISINGDYEMEYRIEKKEAFRIMGISIPLEKDIEQNFQVVPQMWGKAATDGTIPKLCTMMDGEPKGILGVSCCHDDSEWKYYISVVSSMPLANDFEEYLIPESTWAIFSGTGDAKSIQDLEIKIVTEWLPTSGYEYGTAPDFEVYLNADPVNSMYEVWLPVVKK